ncbi:SDR family NAD(P)-dependent oxidoreductase [Geothrix sp. 21YS21S-4]|uniref:SDR family NAD(P)-dependent oxidoreductase n=1 Tax=Geothrix sp. 21YS21S-4 TaxID=3068889 RepID=UPI0027B8CBAE|nr:SDR family oxidoreductase [Geothrix sp. 21YS21S-4]
MGPLWKNARMERISRNGRPCFVLVGGRQRLGRALAEDLARDHDLVLTSSGDWESETWVEELSKTARVRTLRWDAESPELVSRMMADLDGLAAEGWTVAGAILVAGTFPEQLLGSWEPEALAATWRLNLTFPFLCAQALASHLAEGACLQLLLDTSLHQPWLKRLPYSAAKAGLAALVPGLAQLLAPKIRVVGHALGAVLPAEARETAFLAERSLVKRIGDPSDLCRAVRYAAASPFLTGEILTLDGGRRWV